jgi:hypothetical protein
MMPATNDTKLQYKQRLKAQCVALLSGRVAETRQAMDDAQQSANSEEKSSAGDKYETGRAMSMIDRDRNAKRLEEVVQELLLLQSIPAGALYEHVANGAVIGCGEKIYFIATGLGALNFEDHQVIVLSPWAPLANLLRGKKKGEAIMLNGIAMGIEEVF